MKTYLIDETKLKRLMALALDVGFDTATVDMKNVSDTLSDRYDGLLEAAIKSADKLVDNLEKLNIIKSEEILNQN